MQINWDSFKVHNQDSRGIRYKFEDLCRILFANEFIKGNKQFRFLHSNPNNPGLETEPIFDEENKRWIGLLSCLKKTRLPGLFGRPKTQSGSP